jgi:hypothetical protein
MITRTLLFGNVLPSDSQDSPTSVNSVRIFSYHRPPAVSDKLRYVPEDSVEYTVDARAWNQQELVWR